MTAPPPTTTDAMPTCNSVREHHSHEKQQQEMLQQQQDYDPNRTIRLDQMEATMNLLVNPVWIFDYLGRRMRWANRPALDLFNATTLEAFLARDFTQMSAATIKRNEEILWTLEQGRHLTDQWTFYPKGQAKTARVTIGGIRLLDDLKEEEDGSLPQVCFLVEGILLEQRELDNELLRGVEMLRHLPIAVCQFDVKGNCMFQNPEACLLEEEVEETAQRKRPNAASASESTSGIQHKKRKKSDSSLYHRFVDPEIGHRILQQINCTTNATVALELEATIHTQKGPTWSAIQIRKALDPVTGEPVLLYSAQDKTDAVKAREERQLREQKAEFFAIIAHEVRTPLHQVTGYVDLLDQTNLNTEQKSFVAVLKSSTQGLMSVINDLLDFSKLEAGKLQLECIPHEPLAVTKGSMEAVRAQCEERDLYLRLDWDPNIPFRLQNDPNRLRQILLNLLSNSVKFTKTGGITVHAEYLTKRNNDDDRKDDDTNTPCIRFTIKDTGIGISEAHLATIFQKYQQANKSIARRYGGTGLGLSICTLLTKMMGGEMGVDSELGKGTNFWFILPAREPTEKDLAGLEENAHECYSNATTNSGPSSSLRQSDETGGLQVLVAEDNTVNQKLMVNMLRRMGHTASVAENGKEAIDMIRAKEFDICLMDIQMPVCDGLEATKRLRCMGYTTLPIYGLTASVGRSDFAELGFNDWLPKPIRMKDLKMKLSQLRCRGIAATQGPPDIT